MTKQPTIITYKEPGMGAIEFGRKFTTGYTFYNGMPVIQRLMAGELHDNTNKRVKRCEYCHYYYEDRTRPNNSVVCSPECRNARKAAKVAVDYVPVEPKNPIQYASHLEYPFFIDVATMHRHAQRESLHSPLQIAYIKAARDRRNRTGATSRKQEKIPYQGDEVGKQGLVVKFTPFNREEGKMKTKKMSREEIEAYYAANYSEWELKKARQRALDFERKKFLFRF